MFFWILIYFLSFFIFLIMFFCSCKINFFLSPLSDFFKGFVFSCLIQLSSSCLISVFYLISKDIPHQESLQLFLKYYLFPLNIYIIRVWGGKGVLFCFFLIRSGVRKRKRESHWNLKKSSNLKRKFFCVLSCHSKYLKKHKEKIISKKLTLQWLVMG